MALLVYCRRIWCHSFTTTQWTFRIFSIFFCSEKGKGESEAPRGRGSVFLLTKPGGGGGVSQEGGGGGGKGRRACLLGIWGGGVLNIIFRGPNSHQDQ